MPDRSRWSATPYSYAAADQLERELGLSSTAAAILVRRGHDSPVAARSFLAADERHDPATLPGVDAACARILGHVGRGSRIVVHGDYDVDGVCATAVMVRALRALGADPSWLLPSRFDEGYGLVPATVARLADRGTGLLVTVDCGITAAAEVEDAQARGIDVVVTDHHRPGERLPPCPVVHPGLGGYGFEDLCGTAVAHKLAEALLARAGLDPALAARDLDLVALATVADVVPLRGENRRLAREGLDALSRTRRPGLRALMRAAAVEPGALDARAAGFRLSPRLNAAGRLGRADAALELLLTDDEDRAAEVADELDSLNHERRSVETGILFAAEAACAAQAHRAAIVVAGEDWHAGVIGIVASRLVERHHRPCLVVSLGADGGRGSGRSVAGYDLHAGLEHCAGHLRRFGGHRMAAGFELEAAKLDGFRRAIAGHAASRLCPEDLTPAEPVDAVVPAGALGMGLADELARLGPFGHGNREPCLLVPAARVVDPRSMGGEAEHARFTLTAGGARAAAVAFRTTAASLGTAATEPHDAAVTLEAREWGGAVSARLILRALCPIPAAPVPVLGETALEAVERELSTTGHEWAPTAAGPSPREVRDRRGEGFAGVAGALLSTGARALVVCADSSRRSEGVARILGSAGEGRLALTSWDDLARAPELAEPFHHLVALDPPPLPEGCALLGLAPGPVEERFAHLAWGAPDAGFALAAAEASLSLRAPLAELYRRLRAAGAPEGEELDSLLRGDGAHPHPAAMSARMVRVLVELDLVHWEAGACTVLVAERTELERSLAYRGYERRLRAARDWLGGKAPQALASLTERPAALAQAA